MDSNNKREIPPEYQGRDVGKLAEQTLRQWLNACTSITYNQPENDKEGWDFLLEFPFTKPKRGLPWDTATSRKQCFVQVKGTDVGRNRGGVKLDNWQKLVFTPLPAFFLIFEFDGVELQKAYLIHVHNKWMERVLKRLRQSREGETAPLHKQIIVLKWSEGDRLEHADIDSLILKKIDFVGDDFDSYVNAKQAKRMELGLDAPFLVNVQSVQYSSEEEMYKELVDFAIGISEKMPTSNIIIQKDVRFGEPAETEEKGEGVLSISPKGTPIELTFRNKSGSKKVTFAATAYSPDFFFPDAGLPQEYRKYRIEYPLGEIIYPAGAVQQFKKISDTITRLY